MKILICMATLFAPAISYGCVNCNREIQQAISDSAYPNLFIILFVFIFLGVTIALLTWIANKLYYFRLTADRGMRKPASMPLVSASAILGMGIGGFFDGILFHEILQWHDMITNKIAADTLVNKSVNMFWDGIFDTCTLLTTIIGVCLMWRLLHMPNANRSGYLFLGGLSMGWGLFNLVEGTINHHMMRLHNVYEYAINQEAWNNGFLAFGAILLLLGWPLIKKGEGMKYL